MAREIETERLALRPLAPDDAAAVHVAWTAPGVRRFLWDDEVIAPERTADVLRESERLLASRGYGLWGAWPRTGAGGPLVGFGGFWYFRDPPELELLFGVAEPWWGRGLATELAAALVRYGWAVLGLDELRASTDVGNVASVRVLEKLGFARERRAMVGGLDTLFYRLGG